MSLALSVFDVFAYGIPGSLYLSLIVYSVHRAGFGDVLLALAPSSALTFIGVAIASYLLGHATYGIGRQLNRLFGGRRTGPPHVRAEMATRSPDAQGRRFVERDPQLLLAKLELTNSPAAAEVSRLRATAVMLRNCAPAFLIGALVALVEATMSGSSWQLVGMATLAAAMAAGCVLRGRELANWAHMKTLELAYWAIDDSSVPPTSTQVAASSD